jgi:hypothetical protein
LWLPRAGTAELASTEVAANDGAAVVWIEAVSYRTGAGEQTLSWLSAGGKSGHRVARCNETRQLVLAGAGLPRLREANKEGKVLMMLKKPIVIAAIVGGSFGLGLGGAAIAGASTSASHAPAKAVATTATAKTPTPKTVPCPNQPSSSSGTSGTTTTTG